MLLGLELSDFGILKSVSISTRDIPFRKMLTMSVVFLADGRLAHGRK